MFLLGFAFSYLLVVSYGTTRRTVVITGGNRGIGLAATRQLASTGEWNIVIACRNPTLGLAAMNSLPTQYRNNVEVATLDLADLASIRLFCEEWKSKGRPLDVLACNAGVQHSGAKDTILRTKDGFEDTIGTNHIGHFLLIDQLLPRISPAGRIVIVGSGVHNPEEPGGDVGSAATLGDMSGLRQGFKSPIAMVNDGAYDADKAYKDSKLVSTKIHILYYFHFLL